MRVSRPPTHAVWDRWLAAAGPLWRGWSVCPALLAPSGQEVCLIDDWGWADVARGLASQLEPALRPGGRLIALDLPPVLSIQVAAILNEQRLANVVLVLPRWPYARAILPVDAMLDCLVSLAPCLTRDECLPNVTLVLDNERNTSIKRRPSSDPRADNRYVLSPVDLPDLRALRARGINGVVKIQQHER